MIKVLGIRYHRLHHYFSPPILSKLEIQTQFCLAELNENCSFIHMIDGRNRVRSKDFRAGVLLTPLPWVPWKSSAQNYILKQNLRMLLSDSNSAIISSILRSIISHISNWDIEGWCSSGVSHFGKNSLSGTKGSLNSMLTWLYSWAKTQPVIKASYPASFFIPELVDQKIDIQSGLKEKLLRWSSASTSKTEQSIISCHMRWQHS